MATRGINGFRTPLSGSELTRREALGCVGIALLAATAVYAAHVLRGGWYLDDWITVAQIREAGGVAEAFNVMNTVTYRPGLSASQVALYAIAGEAPSNYLAIGVALTALQAGLFYLVLRSLRFSAVVAGMAAAIFLVLPCIDATRLWTAAFPIQLAGALYLGGVLAALNGLKKAPWGPQIGWHLVAVVSFAASMLTYELIVGVVLVTFTLYAVQGRFRRSVWRLVADWSCAAIVLYFLAQRAVDSRGANTSIGFLWDRAQQMWSPAEEVFRSLIPWSDVLGGAIGLVLLIAGLAGIGIAIHRRDSEAPDLKAWLAIAGLALVFALAGLLMLLPADPYFIPRATGLGNRVSAFAAFGAVVLLLALIAITCGGLGALFKRPAAGFAAALAITATTAAVLTTREVQQQDPWAQAWDEQIAVLSAINDALDGQVSPTAAVITFRHTTFILPADVSVFAYSWDLRGALMSVFHVPNAVGHPWMDGARCGTNGVVFGDGTGAPNGAVPYGYSRDLVFVDADAATAHRVLSRQECERIVATLTGNPGQPL